VLAKMGFLSFLSKKSSDRSSLGIKGQAYHATTASLPPIRGTISASNAF
jgi:hypothetical protein